MTPPHHLPPPLTRYLDKLSIDRDHLRDLPHLGKLLSLKHLSAANNKLTAIPDDIAYVRGLKQLTLVGNALRELNSAVGDLELLEKLEVRSNQLKFLPISLSKLRVLKQLDASENFLTALEPSICDLHEVEKLELKDNPLQRPPASTARQGIGAVRKFFQEKLMQGLMKYYGARVCILGHAQSGKTVRLMTPDDT